jgi:tRNA(Arg) A34 adenosine deaminase TadA
MHSKVAPGVRSAEGKIGSAEEAALMVSELAEEAARNGTFGIGGILVKADGEIVAKAENAVLHEDRANDPTAHVERQLVDWYHKNASLLALPPAGEMTLLSSLDPCAMCTGAILKSGLKAIAVAPDDTAGVLTYLSSIERDAFQSEAHALVARSIGMFPVTQSPTTDPCGNVLGGSIAQSTRDRCLGAFVHSLSRVRSRVGERMRFEIGLGTRVALNRLRIGGILQIGSARTAARTAARDVVNRYAERYSLPRGFSCVGFAANLKDSSIQASLKRLLSADDSVAFVDDTGEIFLTVEAPQTSPARDSVVELVRGYPRLRARVFERLNERLPHPRTCSVVLPRGPETFEDAFLEFGAMGSFLEADRLNIRFPLLLFAAAQQPPEKWLAVLPKFYRDIGVDAGVIDPPDMRSVRPGGLSLTNSPAEQEWPPSLSWPHAK